MEGQVVLITGGNDGIGLATAEALARLQARVYLVGRNVERTENAVRTLRERTRNTHIDSFLADLASQASIHETAALIRRRFNRIDVLINNAAGVFPRFQLSADGLEMTMATNHFSAFLLTRLLLDRIQNSTAGRIINVTSAAHFIAGIDFDSFVRPVRYQFYLAYAQSKLANILFTYELAERLAGSGVTVNCAHPGIVRTSIGNKNLPLFWSLGWTLNSFLFGVSPAAGARTLIYLASSDEVRGVSGGYFARCQRRKSSKRSRDRNLARELWQRSAALTGTAVECPPLL